jgi:hypothetical protein
MSTKNKTETAHRRACENTRLRGLRSVGLPGELRLGDGLPVAVAASLR